jgi:hypothetical protein
VVEVVVVFVAVESEAQKNCGFLAAAAADTSQTYL